MKPLSLILQVKPPVCGIRFRPVADTITSCCSCTFGRMSFGFANLWFSAICGCWSGMVLQCAASRLPAPTPAHSNGRAAAARLRRVVGGTRLGEREASTSSSSVVGAASKPASSTSSSGSINPSQASFQSPPTA